MFASSQLSKCKTKELRKIAEEYDVPNHLQLPRSKLISSLENVRAEKLRKLSCIQGNLLDSLERNTIYENDLKETEHKLEIVNCLSVVGMSEEKKRSLEKTKKAAEDFLEIIKGHMNLNKTRMRRIIEMDAEMQEEMKDMERKFE